MVADIAPGCLDLLPEGITAEPVWVVLALHARQRKS
jgi:hypothetical protein